MHKYVIMGVQGCDKGTQARLLQEYLELVHICVGDIFRWHIQNHTKLGAQVKRIVASGNLVGDEIVEGIIRRRLEEHDWNYGFILDGFPRSASQAQFFLESYDIDAVIQIDVPDHVVRQRVLSRRLCCQCGLDYNLISHRPALENVCDVCGGQLVARPDDTPAALADRLRDYHTKTKPVLDLFRRKELVLDIDGTAPPAEIQQKIRSRLGVCHRLPGEQRVTSISGFARPIRFSLLLCMAVFIAGFSPGCGTAVREQETTQSSLEQTLKSIYEDARIETDSRFRVMLRYRNMIEEQTLPEAFRELYMNWGEAGPFGSEHQFEMTGDRIELAWEGGFRVQESAPRDKLIAELKKLGFKECGKDLTTSLKADYDRIASGKYFRPTQIAAFSRTTNHTVEEILVSGMNQLKGGGPWNSSIKLRWVAAQNYTGPEPNLGELVQAIPLLHKINIEEPIFKVLAGEKVTQFRTNFIGTESPHCGWSGVFSADAEEKLHAAMRAEMFAPNGKPYQLQPPWAESVTWLRQANGEYTYIHFISPAAEPMQDHFKFDYQSPQGGTKREAARKTYKFEDFTFADTENDILIKRLDRHFRALAKEDWYHLHLVAGREDFGRISPGFHQGAAPRGVVQRRLPKFVTPPRRKQNFMLF